MKRNKWGSVYIKYLGQLLILVSVPFAIFVTFMFSVLKGNLETEIQNASALSLLRISNTVDMTVQNIYNQANRISSDHNVMYFLSETPGRILDYDSKSIVAMLENMAAISPFIDSAHIFSLSGNTVISLKSGGDINNFYDNGWYGEYAQNRDRFFWLTAREVNHPAEKKRVITAFYAIEYIGEPKGAVIVNLSVDSLNDFFTVNTANTENMEIYDSAGQMLFPHAYGKQIDPDLPAAPYSVIGNEEDLKSVTTYLKSDKTGWIYVSTLKLTRYSESSAKLPTFAGVSIAAGLLVCLALAFSVFSLLVKDKQKQDAKLKQRGKLLKKAQITAMQTQISPHFLFNILTTIRFMAMRLTRGDNDVTSAITSLLELYRVNLSDSEHFTTVGAELEHVTRYIELQKIRFKDAFDAEFDVSPEITGMIAIKIMLQPIVENAITHGVRSVKTNGMIKIKAYRSGAKLFFEVSDNGAGISADKIDALNQYMQSDYFADFEHLGMKNVNQRVKLIFGDEYGVRIQSGEDAGTTVSVIIPALPGGGIEPARMTEPV
jgi:two-component system sensor histidine kinase YesM